jgi:hypothetical protein
MVAGVADQATDRSAVLGGSLGTRPSPAPGPSNQRGPGFAAAVLHRLADSGRALHDRFFGPSLPTIAELSRGFADLSMIPNPYGDSARVTLANHLIAGANRYGRDGVALMTKLCTHWLALHECYLKSTVFEVTQPSGWSYLDSYRETREAMLTAHPPKYSSALRGLDPLMRAVRKRGTSEERTQLDAAIRRLVETTFGMERFVRQIIHERCDAWPAQVRQARQDAYLERTDVRAAMLATLYTAPANLELPAVLTTAASALAAGDGWLALQLARGVEQADGGRTPLTASAQALCRRAEHKAQLEDIELITLSGHSYSGNTAIAVELLLAMEQAAGSRDDGADIVTAARAGIEALRAHDGVTVAKILKIGATH